MYVEYIAKKKNKRIKEKKINPIHYLGHIMCFNFFESFGIVTTFARHRLVKLHSQPTSKLTEVYQHYWFSWTYQARNQDWNLGLKDKRPNEKAKTELPRQVYNTNTLTLCDIVPLKTHPCVLNPIPWYKEHIST